MRRPRITITLNKHLLKQIDRLIDGKKIRNRSHAIEYILGQYLQPPIKKAAILAGGQGTKLRPYTYEVPKALLPIKGKPILEYLIKNLKKSGIEEIIIAIGYLGGKIKDYLGNGERFGIKIVYSEEKTPLKTGGALLNAKKLIKNQPFLVVYGDVLTSLNFQDLITFHSDQKTIGTVALTTVDQPLGLGQLALHGTKLVKFYQKSTKRNIRSHLVNCGIYVFEPEIFNYFPKKKKSFFIEDVIEKLIEKKRISGFVFEEQWFDVGTVDNYERAIKEYRPLV